jgi:tripartite-type tricarboxylate transporter receptor subunit TctC
MALALGQPKVVDLYIGYSPGGGYDVYARLLARYIGRHLPGNPAVVPRACRAPAA